MKKITIFTFLSLIIVSIITMEVVTNKKDLNQLGANVFGTSLDNLPDGSEDNKNQGIERGGDLEDEIVIDVGGEVGEKVGDVILDKDTIKDVITHLDSQGAEIKVESNFDITKSSLFDDLINSADKAVDRINNTTDVTTLPILNDNQSLGNNTVANDFEDVGYRLVDVSVYVREEMLRSAGFSNAVLTQEDAKGYLFKDIYVGDLRNVNLKKFSASEDGQSFLKVYFFELSSGLISADSVFESVKKVASQNFNTSINATNEFGSASFYVNDSKRDGVAFLMVRFDQLIYGFSYPKQYHPQIKNLVRLIDYEF